MGEKLEKIYHNIQILDIRPTRHNVMLIADCLMQIEELNRMIQQGADGAGEAAEAAEAAGEPEEEEVAVHVIGDCERGE